MSIRTELFFSIKSHQTADAKVFTQYWNNPEEGIHMEVVDANLSSARVRVVINDGSRFTANDAVRWFENQMPMDV